MNSKLGEWWFGIKKSSRRIVISIILLVIAITAYGIAGDYLSDHTNYVIAHDLILDNFGPYNLAIIFIWLFLIIIFTGFLYPLIFKPHDLPRVLNMFSFLLLVRSGFILFTHLQVPLDAVIIKFPGIFQGLNFSNDLFFSGHVAIPFLGFLIFKENRALRYFMLASSIILGITVLLMHVHYSIDVLSAFFITYGVYKIGEKFIPKHRSQ